MSGAYIDANVLLRAITGDPPTLAEKARTILAQAESGRVVLRVRTVVAAEIVWTLGAGFYRRTRREIADALGAYLAADGIECEDRHAVLEALELMAVENVSFVDAFIAISARRASEPVVTFDHDFRRLGADIF